MTLMMNKVAISKLNVSSVLNGDTRMYGKQNLLDDNDDTCWNSASGDEQWVIVQLAKETKLKQINMMFQGGFVCKRADLCVKDDQGQWTTASTLFPADNNTLQTFQVEAAVAAKETRDWAIFFREPTDFFGRITLYRLDFLE